MLSQRTISTSSSPPGSSFGKVIPEKSIMKDLLPSLSSQRMNRPCLQIGGGNLRVVHRIHSTLNICVPLRLIYVIALLPIKGPLYHRIKFVCVQMYLLYPVHITCMMLVCGRYLPSLPAISGDFPVLYKILSTSFLSKAQTICLPENDLYL